MAIGSIGRRKSVIYAEKPFISQRTKDELKPFLYMTAIGVPLVVIMWALGKERQ